jgi:hypothetical protein
MKRIDKIAHEAHRQDRIVFGGCIPGRHLPIDGLVELWFKDAESLNAAFRI